MLLSRCSHGRLVETRGFLYIKVLQHRRRRLHVGVVHLDDSGAMRRWSSKGR
jgi:endonuclease/exonuclease/phosphatase family metal-dependent hydrolase